MKSSLAGDEAVTGLQDRLLERKTAGFLPAVFC
jgi:hypothetical protein